jgi:hypothetical protein
MDGLYVQEGLGAPRLARRGIATGSTQVTVDACQQ